MLKEYEGITNRNREVRCLVFGKHREVNSNNATRWSKQRSARTTFRRTRIVGDAPDIEIRNVSLGCQRLYASCFSQVSEQCIERTITLLNASRLGVIEQREQSIWTRRVTHHDDGFPHRNCIRIGL